MTGLTICDTQQLCPVLLETLFVLFFSNEPLFKTLLCFSSICCLFSFFCSPFQDFIFLFLAFINPFWDDILVVFLLLYLCCPFPFFVCASFLENIFLTSPSQIQLPFIFGCLALLFSIFELLSFHAWCFLLCLFFLLVLFGFLLTVVFTFRFISGVLFSVFLSVALC